MHATWKVPSPGDPLARIQEEGAQPANADLVIEVAGCFLDPWDARLAADPAAGARYPLVPGRHVSGSVVETGTDATAWLGRSVLAPELLPCGDCHPCRRALPLHCREVVRLGVTSPGGLAERLVVPARYVVPLEGALSWGRPLAEAASVGFFALAYQALVSAGLGAGDVAVVEDDEALTQLLRAKGVRETGPDSSRATQRLFVRAGHVVPPPPAGSVIVAYGDSGSVALPDAALWSAEATVRFVRACHPDLYPELLALMIRGEIASDPPRVSMARADEALARCAFGPVLVLRD